LQTLFQAVGQDIIVEFSNIWEKNTTSIPQQSQAIRSMFSLLMR
jgi:hypothetical protein